MPYQAHPVFVPPEAGVDAKIWRYMSFSKLLSMLESGTLHFARADVLAQMDPYEGSLTHVNVADLEAGRYWAGLNLPAEELEKNKAALRTARDGLSRVMGRAMFINCWHAAEDESDAMWKIYSGAHEGVAITSTYRSLADAVAVAEEPINIGRVIYVDYRKHAIDESNVFHRFVHKRKAFSHENELRAIIAGDLPAAIANSAPIGVKAKVDILRLVHAVYISPTSPAWFEDVVRSVLAKLGYSFEVIRSEMLERPPA